MSASSSNAWFTPRLTVERWIARLLANDPAFTSLYGRSAMRHVDDALLVALADALARNTTVATLHLSGIAVSAAVRPALAAALGRNKTVTSLSLGDAAWGDAETGAFLDELRAAAAATGTTSRIAAIDLELKALGGGVVAPLLGVLTAAGTFAHLQTVRLGRNALGDAGVQALCDGLVACGNADLPLRALDLAANDVSAGGATALGHALPILSLTELNLSDNAIGPQGAVALAAGLMRASRLETLTLASAGVGTEGAIALAGALSQHPTLKVLDLRHCGITSDVGDAFEVALTTNQSLVRLDLGQNALGDAAVLGIAQGLAQHPRLTVLNLRSNGIGPDGFRALFEAGSTSLTTLTLFDNPIGNGGLQALSARFPALETLDVGATGIDDAGAALLVQWLHSPSVSPGLVALETAANTLSSVAAWDELAKQLARLRPKLDWTYRKASDDDGTGNADWQQFASAFPGAAGQ